MHILGQTTATGDEGGQMRPASSLLQEPPAEGPTTSEEAPPLQPARVCRLEPPNLSAEPLLFLVPVLQT